MAKSADFVLVPRAEFNELLDTLGEVEKLLDALTQHRFTVRMLRARLEARCKDVPTRKTMPGTEER